MFQKINEMFDIAELVRRAIKYFVEGLIVAIVAFLIPRRSLNLEEVLLIALTASATFVILDTYMPAMGVTAKQGTAFAIGTRLVGGLTL